jgi:hypothetical protein
VNPAERVWIKEQMQLIEEDKLEDFSTYEDDDLVEENERLAEEQRNDGEIRDVTIPEGNQPAEQSAH